MHLNLETNKKNYYNRTNSGTVRYTPDVVSAGAVHNRFIPVANITVATTNALPPGAVKIRKKMFERTKPTPGEDAIHAPVAGAAGHVDRAQCAECRALLQVPAPTQVEGGDRVTAQHQHVLPGRTIIKI